MQDLIDDESEIPTDAVAAAQADIIRQVVLAVRAVDQAHGLLERLPPSTVSLTEPVASPSVGQARPADAVGETNATVILLVEKGPAGYSIGRTALPALPALAVLADTTTDAGAADRDLRVAEIEARLGVLGQRADRQEWHTDRIVGILDMITRRLTD